MIWKKIKNWPNYRAGSNGVILSITYSRKFLKPRLDSNKYHCVTLSNNGKSKSFRVHHLICTAFHGKRPIGKEVCHKKNDKNNNKASNLYWGTRKTNNLDKLKHGTDARGEKCYNAKLSEKTAIEIFLKRRNDETFGYKVAEKLAKKYNVSIWTIYKVGKHTWRHIK